MNLQSAVIIRNNPLLRAKVEDEYDKYIEELKEIVIKSWNKRIKE